MEDLISLYIEDMKEFIAILYDSLLILEKNHDDNDAVNEIFRSFHTMKSSTAVMDFKETAHFIHCMEDLLQEIRDGRIKVTAEVVGLLFKSHDLLDGFIHHLVQHGTEGEFGGSQLLAEVNNTIRARSEEVKKNEDGSLMIGDAELKRLRQLITKGNAAYKLTVSINEDCVYKAVRAWMILEEISKISCIICSKPAKPAVEDFKSGAFNFNDRLVVAVIASGMAAEEIEEELKMALSEISSIQIDAFTPGSITPAGPDTPDGNTDISAIIDGIIGCDEDPGMPQTEKIGEIMARAGYIKQEEIDEILKKQEEDNLNLKFGQIAIRENRADIKDVAHALKIQEETRSEMKSQAYIRIPAYKADNLVDLLGELLITQSLHKQDVSDLLGKDNKIANNILRMERIAKDIQDISMSLRMVSLKQTFQKLYRVGRDTSLELKKDVDISVLGEDTEIDRSVVEKINDPLMHLVRNAISHGIEDEKTRADAGKPIRGNICIQAYNRRGSVYIEISDDGRGLNKEDIYNKALEKGLIDPSDKLSDDEIIRLIYLPGFSTMENVNSISGRGVGMNIVQTEISKLGGKIDIINRPGTGCSFILKIPVNLATINGTVVDIDRSKYVIPTLNIKQLLKPEAEHWVSVRGKRRMIQVRNDILQVIPIDNILGTCCGINYESCLVTVVEHEQKLMALPITAIHGKQEIVVKSVGSSFGNLDFISGATILGDGRVSLILDIEALFKITEEIGLELKKGC